MTGSKTTLLAIVVVAVACLGCSASRSSQSNASLLLCHGALPGVFPFDDNASWEKNAATLRQLHTLRDRIRALEKKNST